MNGRAGNRRRVKQVVSFLRKVADSTSGKAGVRGRRGKGMPGGASSTQTFRDLIDYCAQHDFEIANEVKLQEYDALKGRKALLVSHEFDYTGAPIALHGMAAALKESGYRVVVVSWRKGSLIENYERLDIPVFVDPGCIWSSSVAGYSSMFDVVVANTIVTAPVVNALAGCSIPVLWWIHESALAYEDDGLTERMPEFLPPNVWTYAVGPYAKRLLLECRPRYTANNLLYGVPDDKATPGFAGEHDDAINSRFEFGVIGTIEPRKGQDILVRAIRLLPEPIISRCRFTIVGENHDDNIYEELCSLEAEFPQSVEIRGRVEHDKMGDIYKQIDCLICPSRDDPMPVVAAEAMQHGKIVICSENNGIAEIAQTEECGLVYSGNSCDGLASAIRMVVACDVETYGQWSENSEVAFAKNFSARSFRENVTRVLDELVDICSNE